jgi:hypothetical protein
MKIIPLNVAVESATCAGCGAEADLQVVSATRYGFGGNSGPPEGADLLASQTALPEGWVQEDRKGAESSSRILCGACAGAAKTAVETALPAIKSSVDAKIL